MMHCVGFAFLIVDMTCSPVGQPAVPAARFCQEVGAPIPYPPSTDERVKRRLRELNARFRSRCTGGP